MTPVTLVVLSKYKDIFAGFLESVNGLTAIQKILVRDGYDVKAPDCWTMIQGPESFSMATNANLGWKAAPKNHDILYVGDDVRFTSPDTVELLQEMAYRNDKIGILSPRIHGETGNWLQSSPGDVNLVYSESRLCFICVYIKREVIDLVGYLDDSAFFGYGFEDDDYCLRVQRAGFKLAVTGRVTVLHEHAQSTFLRNHNGDSRPLIDQMQRNREIFKNKWQSA